jgi:hypothetical protein
MPARKITLDLASTRALLLEALAEVNDLDGTEVMVDYDRGRSRINDPNAAAIGRTLLRLTDITNAASGEFGMAYWRFKGYQDPRDSDYTG